MRNKARNIKEVPKVKALRCTLSHQQVIKVTKEMANLLECMTPISFKKSIQEYSVIVFFNRR